MSRLKLALIGVGGVLIYFGWQEWKLAAVATAEPQEISCAELAAAGPGDNAHVTVYDFLLSEGDFVYEQTEGSSTWKKIWIPVFPLGGAYHQELLSMLDPDGNFVSDERPLPKDIRVLLKSKHVEDENALVSLAEADTFHGLVINRVEKLGSKERRLLESSYPGIDFRSVWIVEHGRSPSGRGKLLGFLGGGAALGLLGIRLFFVGRD